MRVEIIASPTLLKMLESDFSIVADDILTAVTFLVDEIIKQPGMCPVDTGNLRAGHTPQTMSKMVKYITNSVYYWVFIVYGHASRLQISPEEVRAIAAKYPAGYMRMQRPTGYKGYVPPNNYLMRAVVQAFYGGYVQKLVEEKLMMGLRGRR